MAKESAAFQLASLQTDRGSPVPLHAQLYSQLSEAITSGRLPVGTRLPSTRALAAEMGLSRNTVQNAFEQLLSEGYLEGKVGSGTYVAAQIPGDLGGSFTTRPWTKSPHPTQTWQPPRPQLSQRGSALSSGQQPLLTPPDPPRAFRLDVPAIDAFPFEIWARLISRYLQQPTGYLLGYTEPAGYRPLREAIATYLGVTRAVKCSPEQVIVVSGSQQAFDLIAKVLLDPGDAVWVEDPGYLVARHAWASAGARIVPVPVDAGGLDVAAGEARHAGPRMVHVVPSHQFPTGARMPVARRSELLEWANRSGAWIVEDDYNSEYCYSGPPPAALQGMDSAGRVIYLGTFRRVMFPGLRVGYIVAPPSLVEAFVNARLLLDGHGPVFEQAVLADFIAEGHFARHLRRMRKLYSERQAALLEAAQRYLAGLLQIDPLDSGLHLVGWLPEGIDDRKVAAAAASQGVEVTPLSPQSINQLKRGGLMLGYAGFTMGEIEEGVRHLAAGLCTLTGPQSSRSVKCPPSAGRSAWSYSKIAAPNTA